MRTKVIINDISPFFFSENFTITPAFYVFCTLSLKIITLISLFFFFLIALITYPIAVLGRPRWADQRRKKTYKPEFGIYTVRHS